MKFGAWIDGIGLLGPGLADWDAARAVLRGEAAYVSAPLVAPPPEGLPPAERRRAGLLIRLALAVAREAANSSGQDPAYLPSVFSSSAAEPENCHAICEQLAGNDRHISPTRFHNSVHNAAAGYWGIAARAMTPASVLCAFDASFAAGLLEALAMVASDNTGTLLSAYDAPYPEPLQSKRPLLSAFGCGLVLMPAQSARSVARIEVALVEEGATGLEDSALEALRAGVPAARALPVLAALARGGGRVVVEYLAPLNLAVEAMPC
jgi:hypothetical protein